MVYSLDMEHNETTERNTMTAALSGADAREKGLVPEYAEQMKQKLLALGQSKEQAEAARQQILERFGK